MKKIHLPLLMVTIVIAFWLSSCKKDNNTSLGATVLDCDYFSTSRTLTNDPDKAVDYIITCYADVRGSLTIEPGTVIEFKENAGLHVPTGGSISATGTSSNPIVFTRNGTVRWKGIQIVSNSVNNKLEYCNISYAGSEPQSIYYPEKSGVLCEDGSRLIMRNCTLSNIEGSAFLAPLPLNQLTFSNNTFTGNTEPVRLSDLNLKYLDDASTFSGNASNKIFAYATEITSDQMWKNPGIPVAVERNSTSGVIWVTNDLTLSPGLKLEFCDDCGIDVSGSGSLNATGTASSMIQLTAQNPIAGAWKGIGFYGSVSTNNKLEYVNIEYGGSSDWYFIGKAGNITVESDTKLRMRNSTIRNSNAYGMLISNTCTLDTLGNIFTNNPTGNVFRY